MAAAIQLDPCRDEISGETYLPNRIAGKSSDGGGGMDNVLQRLGAVESSVSAIRVEVGGIAAQLPHLATKENLKEVKGQVSAIAAQIPHLATKEDFGHLRAAISGMETRLIKWFIATSIAVAGLAFAIAKLVH